MTMRAALLEAHDPEWTKVLSVTRHDIYHVPAFVEFAARWQEPGRPAAFVAEEHGRVFLVPLILRPIPEGIAGAGRYLDATGPWGYPGPIVGPAASDAGDDVFVQRAIASMSATLKEQRIVSAFVRCHPLLSPRLAALGGADAIVEHGESVWIDLARSAEEVWADTRLNHRRAITRALRDGYRVRLDESWQYLEEFMTIYLATMDRLGAAQHWRLPRDYISDLRSTVGERVHLCVVEREGTLTAAALLTEVDGIVEYVLSATSPDHVAASPTKLLIDWISRWARTRRNRVFHLAGSLRQNDSLIHFKRGFSPLHQPVYTWRLVTDRDTYGRLVARRDELDGHYQTNVRSSSEFFPAYRRRAASLASTQSLDRLPIDPGI